jgi:hypothetical protein
MIREMKLYRVECDHWERLPNGKLKRCESYFEITLCSKPTKADLPCDWRPHFEPCSRGPSCCGTDQHFCPDHHRKEG